jgi:hypothetical protein
MLRASLPQYLGQSGMPSGHSERVRALLSALPVARSAPMDSGRQTGAADVIGNYARRQTGGPVASGSQYVVGEQSPELMVSGRSRAGAGPGGNKNITINFTVNGATNAESFLRSRSQIQRALRSAVDDGTMGNNQR